MNWVDVGRFLVVAGTIILVWCVFIMTDKTSSWKTPRRYPDRKWPFQSLYPHCNINSYQSGPDTGDQFLLPKVTSWN